MIPVPELRTLPSRLARLCLDVERFCRDRLKMQDSRAWLLAVSGGADSTALLCIMTLLAPRHGWLLHVAISCGRNPPGMPPSWPDSAGPGTSPAAS